MSTRSTFLQTPTVEIDQDRYEELIKHKLQYEQYKQKAEGQIKDIIELNENIENIESEVINYE